MTDTVIIQSLSESGVLTLTFNRPEKKNAFNRAAWSALRDIFTSAKNSPKVACIVLQGAGNNFSSGMDLGDFGGEADAGEHP
ncbi:MAG: enoyl-CoA hydratase/isomerase family protein, partial [Sinobacterium sp.]|nr:enoyl-CoA hydratase/isomerase family protein [Sinobacterium sp.]